jgi:Zn-dependent protease
MSQQEIVLKIFEYVILLFALSLHEAAHAWMASRLGDPTARMLGRITLNPVKHIDMFGTVLIPLAMLFLSHGILFGWAKPTPVTTRNFRKPVRDDILATLAGPVSNILAAVASLVALAVIAKTTPIGNAMIKQLVMFGGPSPELMAASPIIAPLIVLLYLGILLNLFLAAFNLIPLPPLDGSHVLRHLLPYKALRFYDSLGMISLVLILFFGGPIVSAIIAPALSAFDRVLLAL